MRKLLLILIAAIMLLPVFAQVKKQHLNIVYIGNSITQGVLIDSPKRNAPPVKASIWLKSQLDIGTVRYSNQGVSGNTTVDFLPASHTFFPKVKEAADEFQNEDWAELIFSIMIGTNDSAVQGPNGSPVSPAQYYTNVKVIIDQLLALYPQAKVVVHRPIWYSPNTHNGAIYLQAGLQRLESYYPQLQALIAAYGDSHPGHVYWGDTEAFDYFREHAETLFIPENGNAGIFYLHPNEEGAAVLGEFWAKAIYRILPNIN